MENKQYLNYLRASHPHVVFIDGLPKTVRPEDISKVIHGEEAIEFIFLIKGKLHASIMGKSEAQREIMRLKKEICNRSEYLDRVEDWECRNHLGFFDMGMQFRLIDSRMTDEERDALSDITNSH